MKKLIALLLAAIMVFALVACAAKTEPAKDETPADTTTTDTSAAETETKEEETPAAETTDEVKKTIYVLAPNPDHGWTGAIGVFAQQKVDELNAEGKYNAVLQTFASADDQMKHPGCLAVAVMVSYTPMAQ